MLSCHIVCFDKADDVSYDGWSFNLPDLKKTISWQGIWAMKIYFYSLIKISQAETVSEIPADQLRGIIRQGDFKYRMAV